MSEKLVQKEAKFKISLEWLFQLIASVSWMISVFIYGSYELGDCFQLLAASAWTVSNIMSYFNESEMSYVKAKEIQNEK